MQLGPKNLEKLRGKVLGKKVGIICHLHIVCSQPYGVDESAQEAGTEAKGKSTVKFIYDSCRVQMPVHHRILQDSMVKEGKLVIFLFRAYTVTLRISILE